jgi:hypothetical protein
MASFKSYIDQELFVEFAQQAFTAGGEAPAPLKPKPLSATKDEIMDIWKKLRPDLPLVVTPLSDTPSLSGEKSTYGEDGVRITGSWPFIAGVLGRLKDFLTQESPQSKLKLVFRGIDNQANPQNQSYAFYVNVERRGSGGTEMMDEI